MALAALVVEEAVVGPHRFALSEATMRAGQDGLKCGLVFKHPDRKGARPRTAPQRFCSRSEFNTTETELRAIAAEAIIGLSLPSAATGMATVL